MPINLQNLVALAEQAQIKFTLADVMNLLDGQPLNIQVDPFNEPNVLGKTLTISLEQNAIQIQLH